MLDLGPPRTHPAPCTPPQILNLASCPWGGPGAGVGPLSRAATLASHRPCLGLSPSQPRPPFCRRPSGTPLEGTSPSGHHSSPGLCRWACCTPHTTATRPEGASAQVESTATRRFYQESGMRHAPFPTAVTQRGCRWKLPHRLSATQNLAVTAAGRRSRGNTAQRSCLRAGSSLT